MAPLRPDLAQAVGSLLRADPAHAVTVAARLRGPDRFVESIVDGGSMGPSLPRGSRIRIEVAARDAYAVGEVVAALARGTVVVHRVVFPGRGASAGRVMTRGDAVVVPDPPLETSRVLGAVAGVWRDDAWASLPPPPRRSPTARIACDAVLLAAGALSWLSPSATASVLGLLHRAESAVRGARLRRSAPVPGGHQG